MPYEWQDGTRQAPDLSGASSFGCSSSGTSPDRQRTEADIDTPPLARLSLWPYRSLTRRGFVWFIGGTVALISLPVLAVIGTMALWGLLPFLALAVAAMWYFLERSYKDGTVLEELDIHPDRITLRRHEPRGPARNWEANPHWVSVHLHRTGGPVENYLTLKGGGREVELGAFLTPDERKELYDQLERLLVQLRTPHRF